MANSLQLTQVDTGFTASNTVAATTLAISCGYQFSDTNPTNYLCIIGVAIFAAGVSVSSISNGSSLSSWTRLGSQIDAVTGIRCEMWSLVIQNGTGNNTATINFSGSTLASAVSQLYTQGQDYSSNTLVSSSPVSSGKANQTLTTILPNVVAGNLIVVPIIEDGSPASIASIVDSIGTSYVNVVTGASINEWCAVYAGIAPSSTAGNTITIVCNASAGINARFMARQFSNASAVVDTANAFTFNGGPGFGTGNITTTNANDLVYVSRAHTGSRPSRMLPEGILSVPSQSYSYADFGDGAYVTTATGTYTTASFGNNVNNVVVTVAFRMGTPYTPTAAPTPATAGTSGAGLFPLATLTPQSSGNMVITVFAVNTLSGDSFQALSNSAYVKAVSPPAVTTATAVLMSTRTDALVPLTNTFKVSTSRNWAAFSWELCSGNLSDSITDSQTFKTGAMTTVYNDAHQLALSSDTLSYKVPTFEQAASGATLSITGTELKTGFLTQTYSENLNATGGFSPYTFSIISGSLPTGLSLNSSTGVISGTPTATGVFNFTVKAVDSASNIATNSFTITVSTKASNYGFIA